MRFPWWSLPALALVAMLCAAEGEVRAQLTPPPQDPAQPAGANQKEQELLEQIRRMKAPPWRRFGVCRYDWAGWRLGPGGVRVTQFECGEPPQKGSVAVHCDTLRINRRIGEAPWEPWRLPLSLQESPGSGGEDLMVASLCANLRPPASPKGATVNPKPPAKPVTPAKPAAPAQPPPPQAQ